jgi:hypothetical protein
MAQTIEEYRKLRLLKSFDQKSLLDSIPVSTGRFGVAERDKLT